MGIVVELGKTVRSVAVRHIEQFGWRKLQVTLAGLSGLLLLGGCEMHSFLDPSVTGRWQRTPVVLPILDQLDVIDEPTSDPPGLTQVQPTDLVPTIQEYVIGSSDLITVTVFELLVPGVESVQTRRVDELGVIRLPIVGPIKARGLSPSQLEREISQALVKKGVFNEPPTVSVILQEQRQNTFSVIGESTYYGTAIGTYTILGTDFRLLDAMALARGVPGTVKKLYVIRPVPLAKAEVVPTPGETLQEKPVAPVAPTPENPGNLLEDLLKGVETPATQPTTPAPVGAAPVAPPESPALTGALDNDAAQTWVNVDGKWMRVAGTDAAKPAGPTANAPGMARPNQRIIEIPYDKLLEGDTNFNVIIRAGDVIRVPPPVIGNVYIGGSINRPGTYSLPGDRDLTLKQLVIAAGGLNAVGIPERTDLIRRLGKNQEATVRLNLRAIFAGTQPDIFLKPNDTINIGTNFIATPLAVVRNGFRMTYGFGFVLDRNFDESVFGPRSN